MANEETGIKKAVEAAEPQLRAALKDVLDRFGGGASIHVELPIEEALQDDPQWSGNVYKYSF